MAEPITDAELRDLARSLAGDDPAQIAALVSSYRAGERLGRQMDSYRAAGITGGLPGAEMALLRGRGR